MLRKFFTIVLVSFACFSCSDFDYNEISVNDLSKKILIDASHDGGVWWFPQSITTGFSKSAPHQGKLLADLLRTKGFIVDELPSYALITDSILLQYDKVIRAGCYGSYQESELKAYNNFLNHTASLFLISEFQQPAQTDQLAERLGIDFRGTYYGDVNRYASHKITEGATPFYFNAGAIVTNQNTNPNIQILGWLDDNINLPVAGILAHPNSKIFFLGEINGIETVPQPLTDKIVQWLFQ